jgi:hypothetical protein
MGIGTRTGWPIEISLDFNNLQTPLQVYQVTTNKIRDIIVRPVINSQSSKTSSLMLYDLLAHRGFSPDVLQGLTAIFLESGGIAKPVWRFVFG